MEFIVKSGHPEKQRTACIAIGVFEGRKLSKSGMEIDDASGGYLSKILRRGDIEGKLGQSLILFDVEGTLSDRVLLIGCGKEKDFCDKQYQKLIAQIVNMLDETGSMDVVNYLCQLNVKGRSNYEKIRLAVEATYAARYHFEDYKSDKTSHRRPLRKMTFVVPSRSDLNESELAVKHAVAISHGRDFARDMKNTPPNVATPEYIRDQAKAIAASCPKMSFNCLDTAEMEKLGMGCLLAVGSGSRFGDYLINMEYNGGKKNEKPIVLVGKGVSFDTGGICIKPAPGMHTMKMDMGGAAGVLGIMKAIAELKLPINVVGTIATVENSVDANSYRPGDVLTSMSGQTVEVLNTDAEGRLILCDALTYIEKYDPEYVIDMATLTGAIIISLGDEFTGVFGNHSPLINDLLGAGKKAGDLGWHLPMTDAYNKKLKSDVADLANVGDRSAGSIVAAMFLAKFTKKYKWVHLDVAGSAMGDFSKAYATGRPVPMMVQYFLDYCAQK